VLETLAAADPVRGVIALDLGQESFNERRLPEPDLAGDPDDFTAPCEGLAELSTEFPEFGFAPDDRKSSSYARRRRGTMPAGRGEVGLRCRELQRIWRLTLEGGASRPPSLDLDVKLGGLGLRIDAEFLA